MRVVIDVHCHLTDNSFINDLEEVIARAKRAGVICIITSIIRAREIPRAEEIVRKYRGYVYLSVGCDPTVFDYREVEELMSYVERKLPEVIAIGEVGLDYFLVRDHILREVQKSNFIKWIELANRVDRPLVIHSRSAGKYAIEILIGRAKVPVVMHAYDGGVSHAEKAAEKGFYFSIPPTVVTSDQKQKLVKVLPLENLLLESDAPVLSPKRGVRNEPANIAITVRKIAEIKGISVDKVIEVTTENARRIFRLRL